MEGRADLLALTRRLRGWRRTGRVEDTWAGQPIVALVYATRLT